MALFQRHLACFLVQPASWCLEINQRWPAGWPAIAGWLAGWPSRLTIQQGSRMVHGECSYLADSRWYFFSVHTSTCLVAELPEGNAPVLWVLVLHLKRIVAREQITVVTQHSFKPAIWHHLVWLSKPHWTVEVPNLLWPRSLSRNQDFKRSGDSNAVWTTPGGEMHAKEPMWFATRSGPPIWMCAVLFGESVVRFLDSAVESKFFFSAWTHICHRWFSSFRVATQKRLIFSSGTHILTDTNNLSESVSESIRWHQMSSSPQKVSATPKCQRGARMTLLKCLH